MADGGENRKLSLAMSWAFKGGLFIAFVIALSPAAQVEAQAVCKSEDNGTCNALARCDSGRCACDRGAFSPSGNNNDCRNESVADESCGVEGCAYCLDNSGCVKCISTQYLYNPSQGNPQCVNDCPVGTDGISTIYQNIPRRLCEGQAVVSTLDETVLIIIVCIVGVLLLIVSSSFAGYCLFAFVKARRASSFEIQDSSAERGYIQRNVGFTDASEGPHGLTGRRMKDPHDVELSGNRQSKLFDGEEDYDAMFGYEEHSEEMIQFLLKLDKLRRHSTEFLRMLNDMRRRLKELPAEAPAAVSYRNVMSDITRLLFLLNKKPENVEMPPDGLQLLEWSEQTLNHYLESQRRAMTRRQQMEQASALSSRASSYEEHQAETHF